MGKRTESVREFYDNAYRSTNYFDHKEYLYRPYVRALIAVAGLQRRASVLDAGCGQAFFSHLFADEGMVVYATDLSTVALQLAKRRYGKQIACFASYLQYPAIRRQFDCVFIRSCSVYNDPLNRMQAALTESLLSLVKENGILIFAYNTNLSGGVGTWRQHSLCDIQKLIDLALPGAELYFVNRLDTLVFGHRAFSSTFTAINDRISRLTRFGGEAVAVFRKSGMEQRSDRKNGEGCERGVNSNVNECREV
jgi:SAM-dependent methyltransferase